MTTKDLSKAAKLETQGDQLGAKSKFKAALKKYRRASLLNPERRELYQKLIDTKKSVPGEWDQKDFAESLAWTMKQQELEHPGLRQLHTRLSPEWDKISDLAFKIINAPEEETAPLIEELVGYGETATRVLIGILRELATEPPKE